ncbi:MAG: class I SAM-dependent methyltransferase [Eubacteriales bacterium]|nr:class I SAM-dependent methyltransferase [Eubacteriales bacterium]
MGWTKNFGKPEGILGKIILSSMNSGHTPISKWGLLHYDWKQDTVALDIGCGGGMNVKRMLKLSPKGIAAGIDISDESVRKSKQVNQRELGKRCSIKKGSADAIPYKDETFDIVTAFETIYFWPDIPKAFDEVMRVLKPGGTFMVICEMSDPDCVWNRIVEGIKIYTEAQLKNFFTEAGFQDIKIDHTKKIRLCVTGKKA